MTKWTAIIAASFFTPVAYGQRPVKYQLFKLSDKVIPPPNTPAEAFDKTQVKGEVEENRMFGSFYSGMEKIAMELHRQSAKQIVQNLKDKNAGEQAMADGFGNLSTSEQAQYLKRHPQLQRSSGVNSSMMDLAAKMQDPAFKKNFDAMSDEEKARVIMQYQKSQVAMNPKVHSKDGTKAVSEAAKLIDQFNQTYFKGGLANFGKDLQAREKALDENEALALKPVLEERHRIEKIGIITRTDAHEHRLRQVIAQERMIRNKAFENKLSLYQSEVSTLVTRFKLGAKPFDDFLARNNYGDGLDAANEAKELSQLAGYQEGLLREIVRIQDIAKGITLSAAQFFKESLEAEKGK